MSAQIHERRIPFERPPRIRAMLTLEVASEVLKLAPESTEPDAFAARMQMREQTQEFDAWYATIVAGSSSEILTAVAAGRTTLGIASPPELVAQAYRGEGPFTEPIPIRRIFSCGTCEIICAADAPEDFVTSVCKAIDARKGGLGLERSDSPVPLHAAAEAFFGFPE